MAIIAINIIRLVSAAGFEPTAPGFNPTSAFAAGPAHAAPFVVWTVPSPWTPSGIVRCRPSSLYTLPPGGGLGSGSAPCERTKRSPTLSGSTAPFPRAAPNSFRNPVLYPAELRGPRRSDGRHHSAAAGRGKSQAAVKPPSLGQRHPRALAAWRATDASRWRQSAKSGAPVCLQASSVRLVSLAARSS